MTVVVATPKGMWCDSQVTYGSISFPTDKIFRIKKQLVGVAGNNQGIERFMRWYTGDQSTQLELSKGDNFQAVILSKKGLFVYGNSSLPDLVKREWVAIGCGAEVAMGALAAGATPHRAVEIACDLVDGCGLPVQAHKL